MVRYLSGLITNSQTSDITPGKALMNSTAPSSSSVRPRDGNPWKTTTKADHVSIGTNSLFVSVSGPPRHPTEPIIIIFPGSNAGCDSWQPVATEIQGFARVLLYDRSGLGQSETGTSRDTGAVAAAELTSLLRAIDVPGPYILVAHSYGGCVAREFLQLHQKDVVGMVFSETGTETKCQHAEEQYRTRVLGDSPLSVIRGESAFCGQRKGHEGAGDAGNIDDTGKSRDGPEQSTEHSRMLEAMEKLDEELKREQLQLSKKGKFRNVPNCGHNVHLVRPDVVVEEVRWVLEHMEPYHVRQSAQQVTAPRTQEHENSGILQRLRRRILLR
ncbi:MAG: hypothetical protein OHK93_005377 [Ramalina farinacea]|uniref:AB hydrolase-1 domain-containing protein n=1 Tax=Ramalina farinacea TaxID=258253 RepID=A0AA43QY70_9LECA|nr:hypothetical protein [Ramalina farinacea]